MNKTGFTALNHRRYVRLFVAVTLLLLVATVLYFAINRGTTLIRMRAERNGDAVSVEKLWEEGKYNSLAKVAENLLIEDPMNKDALLFAGYSRYFLAISRLLAEERTRDLDLTIRHLRLLLAHGDTPHPERVHYVLGKAYLLKGQYWSDLAVKYLSLSIDYGYEPDDIYEYLGKAYATMGRNEDSLKWYLKAAEKYSTDRLFITLGEEAFKLGYYNDAAEYYHKAVELSHDDSLKKKGLLQLGQLYYDVGNYKEARKILERLVDMDSNNKEYLFLFAETLYALGESYKARVFWLKVTRIDPLHKGALLRLYD